MALRPRQHQLEDESRLAFKQCLPSHWVFRDHTPDYGFDGEVEVFDEKFQSTGLRFYVQLKATDSKKLNQALSVRISSSNYGLYNESDTPVLIVRYHAPTKSIYSKWFHSFDRDPAFSKKKTITLKLSDDDKWNPTRSDELVEQLKIRKYVLSPTLSFPLPLSVCEELKDIGGIPTSNIIKRLKNVLRGKSTFIKIVDLKQPHVGVISFLESKKITIRLADECFYSLKHTGNKISESELDSLPYDLLIGVAIALDNIGHSDLAARLISEFAAQSSFNHSLPLLGRLSVCMAKAHRVHEALALGEKLFDFDETMYPTSFFALSAMMEHHSLTDDEAKAVEDFWVRMSAKAIERDQLTFAATCEYNLGNSLRNIQPRRAFLHYQRARKFDPSYIDRPYFWGDVAGILFDLKKYRASSRFYQKAIDLGGDNNYLSNLGNSLLFGGLYESALKAYKQYLSIDKNAPSIIRIRSWCLKGMIGALKVKEQHRQPLLALEKATIDESNISGNEIKDLMEDVLKNYDLISVRAWHNYGCQLFNENEEEEAFIALLIAACISPHRGVEPWLYPIQFVMRNEGYKNFIIDVILAAYDSNKDDFISHVQEALSKKEGFPAEPFLELIDDIIRSYYSERPSEFEIRLGDKSIFIKDDQSEGFL